MVFPSIPALLKKHRIHPKKRWGQNFLIAQPTLEKIVASIEPQSDDVVIEIGSGLGVMTAILAQHVKQVIAIEKDATLLAIAQETFSSVTNIEWVEEDFLTFDMMSGPLRASRQHGPTGPRARDRADRPTIKIVGNIPYEITSPILFKLLDHPSLMQSATLLMQKEVALRIAAKPGTKDYGILAVCCQAAAECRRLFDVSAQSFIPEPAITSSVVKMDFRPLSLSLSPQGRGEGEGKWFRTVVRAAFGQRRKTLRNALLGSTLGKDAVAIDRALAVSNIDGRRRPETLLVTEFSALAMALDKGKSPLL